MRKFAPIILCSIVTTALGIGLYAYLVPQRTIIYENRMPGQVVSVEQYLTRAANSTIYTSSEPNSFITAAKKTRESVVYIRSLTQGAANSVFNENMNASTGSGVIVSPDGYIATNHHVVENADAIEITLNDNKEYNAEVIGTDPSTDLALLKIEANNLPFSTFGNSDSLQIGEWVMAVGNPFRLQSTVTAGIVSAKARNINVLSGAQGIESFIQTDAAVNPGNSGGALVNTKGELVGINSAIISASGRYEGFSFAIPANLARKIIYDLKEFGAVQRGWLGVQIHDLSADEANRLGLDFVQGIYLDQVTKGSAAQDAKLQKGDVFVSVNRVKTLNTASFMEQVGRFRPGDEIELGLYRKGRLIYERVILRNQLNTTDFIAVRKDPIFTELGFELRDLDSTEKTENDWTGVYVVSVYKNSIIDATQMAPGYIITSINDKPIDSVNDLMKALKIADGQVVLEGKYERYPGVYPYTFTMP